MSIVMLGIVPRLLDSPPVIEVIAEAFIVRDTSYIVASKAHKVEPADLNPQVSARTDP